MEETALLHFEVDQTKARNELVQTEKNILSLKKEQAALNKEYKSGKITEDEYVKSNVKLQQSIKKETDQKRVLNSALATESNSRNAMRQRVSELNKEYNNLNITEATGIKRSKELEKELTQLNNQLNKGSKAAGQFKDNIGNYPEQFANATNQVKPFGLSVEGASSSFSKFLSPAGAALGVLTGLVSLYTSSAAGAKDLAFATDVLGGSFKVATNAFGDFVKELTGGTGEEGGILSKLAFIASSAILGLTNASAGLAIASAERTLKELEIISIDVQGIRKQYEKAAEDARRLRDDEEQSFADRLAASKDVEANLNANLVVRQKTQERVIEQLQLIAKLSGADPEIRKQIKGAQAEIRDIQEEINGKLTENIKARGEIQKLINADAAANKRIANKSNVAEGSLTGDPFLKNIKTQGELAADFDKRLKKEQVKRDKDAETEMMQNHQRAIDARMKLDQQVADARLNAAIQILGAMGSLFKQESEEYKAFATFQTLISTYSTAQKAYEAAFVPPTIASPLIGAANVAVAIANGLANIAAIHGIQFAEGGYTGPGPKLQPAGVVHAGEVVWNQQDVAKVGGPAAANAMRPTASRGLMPYADGGFVTNQNIAASQQALIMANAVKNLPQPVVSWSEGRAVGRRVEAREKVARI